MAIKFDSTVNVGNWLTAASLAIGGAGVGVTAYSAIDKRVTVLETERLNSQALASERALNTASTLSEIKADLREVVREVRQIKEQRR